MKKAFYKIAKKHNCIIVDYNTYREKGMGGLQVFEVTVALGDGKKLLFTDSYFHLSGDAPKILVQFEYEIKSKKNLVFS